MGTQDTDFRYDMIVFDVAGTLIGLHDWAPFQGFLSQAGLPATEDDARRFHRRLLSNISARRSQAHGLGANEEELETWWRGNFVATWPHRRDLAEEMFHWLLKGRFDHLYTDVVDALEILRGLGLRMGVLSNFSRQLGRVLERFGLCGYFEFLVVSAEVGLAKPDRRIFDLAASRAGVPRHRLLYVGDHFGDDIEGASGAGIDAVLIDRDGRGRDALCPRIRSLVELVPYVRRPARPARAIIFDMDGVVLDSMPMHLYTWQQTLAPLGTELTAEDLFPLEGLPTEPTAQHLTERLLGRACSQEEAQRLADAKRARFRQVFQPTLVPGIGPLLRDLRGRGYRLGLVTGSAQSVVDESLVPTGIDHLFDVVVTGDQVLRGKPDPEPYQMAATRLALSPSECLVVENAPLGIRSAKAAGMRCVAIETTLPKEQLPATEEVFPDAHALRAWLLLQWGEA